MLAKEVIKQELETYNQWCSGEIYQFILYDKQGEFIDSCCGFYSIEEIRQYLPKEWDKVDLEEYLQD